MNDPHPNLCVDTFTPLSRLRRHAGLLLDASKGELISAGSGGSTSIPYFNLVWKDPSGGRIYTWLTYNKETDSIEESNRSYPAI